LDLNAVAWRFRLEQDSEDDNAGRPYVVFEEKPSAASSNQRLAIASGIRRLAPKSRTNHLNMLIQVLQPEDANDAYLPLQVWYAIEPTIGLKGAETIKQLHSMPIPVVREFMARKLVALDTANISVLIQTAAGSKDPVFQRDLLQGILDGLGGIRQLAMPKAWTTYAPDLRQSSSADVRQLAMILAVTFNDEVSIAYMQMTAAGPKADVAERTAALRVLLRRGNPDMLWILQKLVNDKAMRAEAIRGLAAFNDPGTAATLLKIYPTLSEAEKEDAVQTLASRTDWALALLDAIEQNKVPRRDVSVFVARQIQGSKDKRVGERLTKVWGQIQPASAQRVELTKKYKTILTEETLKKSDVVKGRQLYAKNCASCHKLYDDGGDIGPALTGAQRSNIDYILENVLDPSAVVPREYLVVSIDMKNERRINGIVRAETPKSLTIQTANETLVLPKDEIEARVQSKLSMMPEGIFDKLSEQEVRDLVAYLRGREQVPLPK